MNLTLLPVTLGCGRYCIDYFTFQEELKDAFNIFDKDGDGYLGKQELELVMKNLGDGLNEEELDRMLNSINYDNEGKISFEDFARFIYNIDEIK